MVSTKKIGLKIVKARKKIGISQVQLSEHLFISPQAVGKWERGESMPDITTFSRLAEILGVDLNYFSENFQSADIDNTAIGTLMKQPDEFPAENERQNLRWDMSNGNWVDADFSGVKNLKKNFSASIIKNCKLIGSDLSGLLLKSNKINNSDFSISNLSQCRFQTSELSGNNFKDSSLIEAEFLESKIIGCDFTAADFTKVFFCFSSFRKNTISNAVWNATMFKDNTQIEEVIFDGIIENCHFENCTFKGVEFRNATIINTFFKYNRKLNRVRFIDCKADHLTYAFLKNDKADLTGLTLLF